MAEDHSLGAAPAEPTAWTAPTLAAGWSNSGGAYQVAKYRKHGDVVQLRGMIQKATAGVVDEVIFTFPTGYRPSARERRVCARGTAGVVIFEIDTSGNFRWESGLANTQLSLDCEFATT